MASDSVEVETDPGGEITTIIPKGDKFNQLLVAPVPRTEANLCQDIFQEISKSTDISFDMRDISPLIQPTLDVFGASKDNNLQSNLLSIGLKQVEIEFIIEQGEKFIEKPAVLAAKLKLSKEKAKSAIEILKSFKLQQPSESISEADIQAIETCLKENPEFDDPEDIALVCGMEVANIETYFESLPLNDSQKAAIKVKLNAGNSISDISSILRLSEKKVRYFIEHTFITFHGAQGQKILEIIQSNFPKIECSNLREMIISNSLKLQDQLCCILKRKEINEYEQVRTYFERFEESKTFFKVDLTLTIEDINQLKKSSLDSIEQLSQRLNKVETIIEEYLEQYHPNSVVKENNLNSQIRQIQEFVRHFGGDVLTFHAYRMIISNSFEDLIHEAELHVDNPKEVFKTLLPLVFYYLKCSLPLDDVTQTIANTSKIILTTHDLFHMLFQLSDPVLRGYCIEHYSFSNPVPLYYPKLNDSCNKETNLRFEICKELWYSLQEFNGLVSFGLGRASWNPVGKSYLLDFIFATEFVRGSPQTSAFHSNSIDIQMTKNLFGETNEESCTDSTKWAFIDCHGCSDISVIDNICQHLDIALVHVEYLDYLINCKYLDRDLENLGASVKYLFLFVRDYLGAEVTLEVGKVHDKSIIIIFIPNLTKSETNIYSVKKSLNEIGHQILHLSYDNRKLIGGNFLEKLIGELDPGSLEGILSDKELIRSMTKHIEKDIQFSTTFDFSFLSYYPIFIELMSYFYKAAFETDRKKVDEWNDRIKKLKSKMNTIEMGEVVVNFNKIISRENYSLILWKLSQDLSLFSKKITLKSIQNKPEKDNEQKNDKYTLEIIWREAFLSSTAHQTLLHSLHDFSMPFGVNFSNHVERGEPFELIDGDNLKFFNKDIDRLLQNLYKKQLKELGHTNQDQRISMKGAPIVVSIFGPQNSGKSTLLNYCFGCKFLTSAGRCTRGIYGSFSRLSRPVNLSNHFLILDTEGLDAIERENIKDTSHINFDRTMVLFCLAVSQVVIINVIGDIGSEMQNLLQVCAHSLNRLKVTKVPIPKIFFVLNQQADPDPVKHMDSINILMKKLNEESELVDTGGAKISDLIQVSKENLFILPSAFNSEQMNKNLFDSKVTKLSPTITFADRCADLRMAIINQLDSMPVEERAPFETMSEWMEMSGKIWDTIITYQDIVKYRNVEEEICSDMLRRIVSELMEKNIYLQKHLFLEMTECFTLEIIAIETLSHPNTILTKIMIKFDEIFTEYQNRCLTEFDNKCQNDALLKKMTHICKESKSNLSRLIYMERKVYEDKLKFQIKATLTEIQLSDSMKKFQEEIIKNVDRYLELSVKDQKIAFDETWNSCFGNTDRTDQNTERDETFDDLYSIFRMESKTLENRQTIYQLFSKQAFNMNKIISVVELEILTRFQNDPTTSEDQDHFFYHTYRNNTPIKDMTPFPGKCMYQYLGKDSLFTLELEKRKLRLNKEKLMISDWVPKECRPLVKACSGYHSNLEITWKGVDKNTQIIILASKLRTPNNDSITTWNKIVDNTTICMQKYVKQDPDITLGTVKLMVHYLNSLFNRVNYEIKFIEAKLSNTAERTITTLVFAYAFRSLWDIKCKKRMQESVKKKNRKGILLNYFLQKIENRKMVRGGWDREKMRESDYKTSENFSSELIASVERGLKIAEQPIIESQFLDHKDTLSHDNIFLFANSEIKRELDENPDDEIWDENNFVIQYTCNRNIVLGKLFRERWEKVQREVYNDTVKSMKGKYKTELRTVKQALKRLMDDLSEKHPKFGSTVQKAFDSDSNFEIVNMDEKRNSIESVVKTKESPFKAAVVYLRMYLDPQVSAKEFNNFFENAFEIDDVAIKKTDTYELCDKPTNSEHVLDEDFFKRLEHTKMFNSENIFNIYEYIKKFHSVLHTHEYQLTFDEFREMAQHIKEEFEKDTLGCPSQCPSCGKLCERELHPNDGKCQIKTGHQICSMGGRVWNNDEKRTAVLYMCEDYKDDTTVNLKLGENMNWRRFKGICNYWDWSLPEDEKYVALQLDNRENMRKIWNKFGKGILNYYSKTSDKITYVPYTSFEAVTLSLTSIKCYICFVIDGTGSMLTEIKKARISVGQFISKYKEHVAGSAFRVVIYRDHCDDKMIENFPTSASFTSDYEGVQKFLEGVKAYGGGDYPEAVLDGLATASTKCQWEDSSEVRNLLIHVFDAPPHGDFPDYKSHIRKSNRKHCCCCNHGTLCQFDWKRDVWDNLKKFNIHYHGINTGQHFPGFEKAMKNNLGDLCGDFQSVGKEVVNDAILQIFIDYN